MLWILAPALFSCYWMSQPSFTASSQAGGWVAGPHRGRVVSHRPSHPPGDHSSKPVAGAGGGGGAEASCLCDLGSPVRAGGPTEGPSLILLAHRGCSDIRHRDPLQAGAGTEHGRSDSRTSACPSAVTFYVCRPSDRCYPVAGGGLQAERKRDVTLLPQECWFSGLSLAAS